MDPRTKQNDPWQETLQELKGTLTRATFNTHLVDSEMVAQDGNLFVVRVRNHQAVEWIEARLDDRIHEILSAVHGRTAQIRWVTRNGSEPEEGVASDKEDPVSNNHGDPDRASTREANPDAGGDDYDWPDPSQMAADEVYVAGDEHGRDDPTYAFVAVSHYAQRFWRPFLGAVPFAFWQVLRSYGYYVQRSQRRGQSKKHPWPTVSEMSDALGYGDRYTILGRAARKGYKEQIGAIQQLMHHHVAYYWTAGEGTQTKYYFIYRSKLPVLTPRQLSTLSKRLRKHHSVFLSYYDEYDAEAWASDDRATGIPLNWYEKRVSPAAAEQIREAQAATGTLWGAHNGG